MQRRLRGVLAGDIRVRAAAVAPPGFDARFSALRRRYAYRLSDDPAGVLPLRRRDVAWAVRPLDVAAMDEASRALLGLHDFAPFCRRREGATTVRTLQEYTWARDDDGLVVARVVADAFCHSMVRSLVGAMLASATAAARRRGRAACSRARRAPTTSPSRRRTAWCSSTSPTRRTTSCRRARRSPATCVPDPLRRGPT